MFFASAVLLTYPDAKLSHEDIMENILKNDYFCCRAIVSKETYKHGGFHWHVVISTTNRRWTIKELDAIGGTHGHYKAITTTLNKAIAYVAKDNNFVVWPEENMMDYVLQCCSSYAYPGSKIKIDTCINGGSLSEPRNFKKRKNELYSLAMKHGL